VSLETLALTDHEQVFPELSTGLSTLVDILSIRNVEHPSNRQVDAFLMRRPGFHGLLGTDPDSAGCGQGLTARGRMR
jgi:hypothetical protein